MIQTMWSTVMLATDDAAAAKKKFLSRTARYSGLLNVLDFATLDLEDGEKLSEVLTDANSWIAFNVTQSAIPFLSKAALSAGIKRVIFTTELPPSRINETVIPEFDAAVLAFEAAGAAFTGIRHGTVIDGKEVRKHTQIRNVFTLRLSHRILRFLFAAICTLVIFAVIELFLLLVTNILELSRQDNAYEIVNGTVPCLEDTVERGVLARVVAELLLIDKSVNQQCGVCSSSQFAAAYLGEELIQFLIKPRQPIASCTSTYFLINMPK
jgi:hypothetical protein